MLKTPKDKLNFLMLTFFIYITAPIFEWFSLENDLASGRFSVNSDSIGLGLFQFIFALILFASFVLIFTIWILWKYPPQVSLFGFNSNRPLWSFVWTLIFGILFFESLVAAFTSIAESNIFAAVENFIIGYLCLVFHASIIFRRKDQEQIAVAR